MVGGTSIRCMRPLVFCDTHWLKRSLSTPWKVSRSEDLLHGDAELWREHDAVTDEDRVGDGRLAITAQWCAARTLARPRARGYQSLSHVGFER